MMRKETVLKLLLILTLSSCGNSGDKINTEENEKIDQADNVILQMQSKIDSAVFLCDYALQDYKKGESPQAIILRYGTEVNRLEKASVEIFQEATEQYQKQKINQESYDKIRESVFTDSIQLKMNRLKSLGIDFKKSVE